MSSNRNHILLVPLAAWGHIRPICVLAARVVTERADIYVTIFTAPHFLERTLKEITRHGNSETAKVALQRIRVVSIFPQRGGEEQNMADVVVLFMNAYATAYGTLLNGQPITCASSNTTFEALPPPSLAIIDFLGYSQLKTTQALSPDVPVLAWVFGGSSSIMRLFGPESLGGLGNLGAKIDAEVARTGKTPDEVGEKILNETNGTVVEVYGLLPMYDWEFFPQNLPFSSAMSPLFRGGFASQNECTGVIINASDSYEKGSLDAYKRWIGESNRPVYALGPLLPAEYGKTEIAADKDRDIEAFLNGKLKEHGERSLLYVEVCWISFGTIYWPTVPGYIEEVVESLIAANVPFVFVHASPFAKFPEGLAEKVTASGLGVLTPWASQQTILNHPVTGWSLSHGGHGGITESLGSGVPLIFWPFDGDQPVGAMHVVTVLKAGIELLEVRTGLGMKALKRNGQSPKGTREAVGEEFRSVLNDIRGEKGAAIRKNAQALKEEFAAASREGGSASKELKRLLETYL